MAEPQPHDRTVRARNRALLAVLLALVALFYAIALVRMSAGGG